MSNAECAADPWCWDMGKAPKDKTDVLLLFDVGNGEFLTNVGCYSQQFGEWQDPMGMDLDPDAFALINLPKGKSDEQR